MFNIDASLTKDVHPNITSANITGQTFGQVSAPVNNSRSMQVRAGLQLLTYP